MGCCSVGCDKMLMIACNPRQVQVRLGCNKYCNFSSLTHDALFCLKLFQMRVVTLIFCIKFLKLCVFLPQIRGVNLLLNLLSQKVFFYLALVTINSKYWIGVGWAVIQCW